jgi:hypothetical protein
MSLDRPTTSARGVVTRSTLAGLPGNPRCRRPCSAEPPELP